MPSTMDDLRIRDIRQLRLPDDETRIWDLRRQADDRAGPPTSARPVGNVYRSVRAADDDGQAVPRPVGILRVWWARWRERRQFARAMPWLADEVLADYSLSREEARRLCRRPFWLK